MKAFPRLNSGHHAKLLGGSRPFSRETAGKLPLLLLGSCCAVPSPPPGKLPGNSRSSCWVAARKLPPWPNLLPPLPAAQFPHRDRLNFLPSKRLLFGRFQAPFRAHVGYPPPQLQNLGPLRRLNFGMLGSPPTTQVALPVSDCERSTLSVPNCHRFGVVSSKLRTIRRCQFRTAGVFERIVIK